MKHWMTLLLVFWFWAGVATAQRVIVLRWDNPTNPPGTSATVFRAPAKKGVCPMSVTQSGMSIVGFSALQAGLTEPTYTDTTPVVGTKYCYVAEEVNGSSVSSPSNVTQFKLKKKKQKKT